jgi:hypothetical protein
MIEYFIEELEDAISCFDSRKLWNSYVNNATQK